MPFNSNQPRVPAGSPHGGEFGKGSSDDVVDIFGDEPAAQLAPWKNPGLGLYGVGASLLPVGNERGSVNNPIKLDSPYVNPEDSTYRNNLLARTGKLNEAEDLAVKSFVGPDFRSMRLGDANDLNDETNQAFYLALGKMPVYNGTAYRGVKDLSDEETNQLVSSHGMTLDAMSSFTRNESAGVGFAGDQFTEGQSVLFKMRSNSARNVEQISQYKSEQEVVAGKGTSYRFSKAYYVKYAKGNSRPLLVVEGEEAN